MGLSLVAGPVSEPVTTAEAKTHCRVDISDDDSLIGALITAARQHVENILRRALMTQTWDLYLDDWPSGELVLPLAPLQSVTSVKYTDEDGTTATLASSNYVVDAVSEPGRLVLDNDGAWPSVTLREVNGVVVRFVAGYASVSAIPQAIKQTVLMLVGHWYESREAVVSTGAVPKEVPFAVEALLWPYRVFRWV